MMCQMRQSPPDPWWRRKTWAYQVLARESQYQAAVVQLKKKRESQYQAAVVQLKKRESQYQAAVVQLKKRESQYQAAVVQLKKRFMNEHSVSNARFIGTR